MRQYPPSTAFRTPRAPFLVAGMLLVGWLVGGAVAQAPEGAPPGNDPPPGIDPDAFPDALDQTFRQPSTERGDQGDTLERPDGHRIFFYRCRHKPANVLLGLLNWIIGASPRAWTYGGVNHNLDFPGGYIARQGRANHPHDTLVIEDTPERLDLIQRTLTRIDVPVPQVLLEARIIEINHSRTFHIGHEWTLDRASAGSQGLLQEIDMNYSPDNYLSSLPEWSPPPFQGASLTFSAAGQSLLDLGETAWTIRMLENIGEAEILANPRLLIEEGNRARVFSGEDIYIQKIDQPNETSFQIRSQQRQVGVALEVNVLLVSEDYVKLRLAPSVTEVTGYTDPGTAGVSNPILSNRATDTVATFRNRKTYILGGLLLNETAVTTTGIPLLSDIPLVGELFKTHNRTTSRTEVLFMFTPRIFEEQATPYLDPSALGDEPREGLEMSGE